MKTKLTLSIEEDLIRKAKQQAKKRGTSVSQLVSNYFDVMEGETSGDGAPAEKEHTKFTKSLMGIASGADVGSGPKDHRKDYYEHLERKHSRHIRERESE
jgi:hypothetical protein